MNAPKQNIVSGILVAVVLCLVTMFASQAQQPSRPSPPAGQVQAGSKASIDAQREQIWNSPNMLRARAWLQDYCSTSAKITPEEAQQYLTELEHLSPTQMKLWLLKFDQEEETRQQQYGMWQQAHSAALTRAMAADKATQNSYAAINKGENQAAGEEQQQVNEQDQVAQTNQENKATEMAGPYGPYGYGGMGGIHYHFHLYPY